MLLGARVLNRKDPEISHLPRRTYTLVSGSERFSHHERIFYHKLLLDFAARLLSIMANLFPNHPGKCTRFVGIEACQQLAVFRILFQIFEESFEIDGRRVLQTGLSIHATATGNVTYHLDYGEIDRQLAALIVLRDPQVTVVSCQVCPAI
jgi:hypothetical protein